MCTTWETKVHFSVAEVWVCGMKVIWHQVCEVLFINMPVSLFQKCLLVTQ